MRAVRHFLHTHKKPNGERYLKGKQGKLYGLKTRHAVRKWKKLHGIGGKRGRYGENTHEKMAPKFDSFSNLLYRREIDKVEAEKEKQEEKRIRNGIVGNAMYGYRNRSKIHYTQTTMRMQGVREQIRPPRVPAWEDCSSFATWCYWDAGAPDPNGLNYNGQGYTGTQIENGKKISENELRLGDLVFYGNNRGAPTHVAVYVGGGKVVSHGSDAGPYLLPIRYRFDINQFRSYL